MKKSIRIILPILLIISCSVITPKPTVETIDDLLLPYQVVIDKVNND